MKSNQAAWRRQRLSGRAASSSGEPAERAVHGRVRHGKVARSKLDLLRPRTLGQAVVEFAVVLPIFLLLLLMAIDFGRIFFTYVQVNNAAREAAAYGAQYPLDLAGMQAIADKEANVQSQSGQNALFVTATCRNAAGTVIACSNAAGTHGSGSTITITTTEKFNFMTPFVGSLFGGGLTMEASTTVNVLVIAAGGGNSPGVCYTIPTASFTVAVDDLTVTLDASASTPITGDCAISGYNWEMGDGADPWPPVVNMQPPPYSYTAAGPGIYTITLEVTNPAGNGYLSQTVTVGTPLPSSSPSSTPTAAPTPTPGGTAPPPVCNTNPGFTYQFTGSGGGTVAHQMTFYGNYTGQPAPTSWQWNFGDGTSGTGQTVSRNYASAGTYNVTLTTSGSGCIKTYTAKVTVP
jgi:PKD repeat protein